MYNLAVVGFTVVFRGYAMVCHCTLHMDISDWPCDVNLTSSNGQFASPRWPNLYPSHSSCQWRISGPPGATILVRFSSLELEDHTGSNCKTAYDKIEIYDSDFTTSNSPTTLCGNIDNYLFTSTANLVTFVFTSDARVQAKGFHASYAIIEATTTTQSTTTTKITTDNSLENTRTSARPNASFELYPVADIRTDNEHASGKLENISDSVQMAMVGEEADSDGKTVDLTAVFVEPLNEETRVIFHEDNVTNFGNGVAS